MQPLLEFVQLSQLLLVCSKMKHARSLFTRERTRTHIFYIFPDGEVVTYVSEEMWKNIRIFKPKALSQSIPQPKFPNLLRVLRLRPHTGIQSSFPVSILRCSLLQIISSQNGADCLEIRLHSSNNLTVIFTTKMF